MRQLILLAALVTVGCSGSNPVTPSPTPTPTPTPTVPACCWSQAGSGNTVFDMPAHVARVQIVGVWNGTGLSNFIVRIGGRGIVNEILRETGRYEGVHLTGGGGIVEIANSSTIAWTLTEVR